MAANWRKSKLSSVAQLGRACGGAVGKLMGGSDGVVGRGGRGGLPLLLPLDFLLDLDDFPAFFARLTLLLVPIAYKSNGSLKKLGTAADASCLLYCSFRRLPM